MVLVRLFVAALAVAASVDTVRAGFVFSTIPGSIVPTDELAWAPPSPSTVPFPFTFTSAGGIQAVVTAAGDGDITTPDVLQIVAQNNGWDGKFVVGDPVLYSVRSGPITISFAEPLTAAGAQFEPVQNGPFTARLELLAQDGTTVLATADFDGDKSLGTQGDGSAVFAGFTATGGDSFYGVRFTGLTTVGTSPIDVKDFAINQLLFSTNSGGTSLVPAPAGLLAGLLGTGAFGLGRLVRRRTSKS